MEFERAIFRVYERCIDGLRDDSESNENDSKGCRFLEFMTFAIGLCLMLSLAFLHNQFVGNSGCLIPLLVNANNMTYPANVSELLSHDKFLNINVDHEFMPPKNNNNGNLRRHIVNEDYSAFREIAKNLTQTNYSSENSRNIPALYDYQFSFEVGELFLPESIRESHNFEVKNVTLMGSACFGSEFTQSLIAMGGIDTVVINALMFTFRKPGYMVSSTGDYYKWTAASIEPYSDAGEWLNFKTAMIFNSLASFCFLSTITALLVRVLISSGVVLLFPLFWMIQQFGVQPINLRIISLSYPWIGVPMEMMLARHQSTRPFLIAHFTRVVVYYLLYQATQSAFGSWFYRPNSSPGQPELWLFALMMVVEYFSMIYVRAKQSIALFPRAFLALFLVFHFYYYSFPSGFHMLALATLFMFTVTLMAFCIRRFEIDAYYTGVVSIDSPRMLFNALPWPVMRTDLAPDFTLFMPLTSRAVGVYQAAVPAVGVDGNAPPPSQSGTSGAVQSVGGDSAVLSPVHGAVVDVESGVNISSTSSAGTNSLNSNSSRVNDNSRDDGIEMAPTYHDPEVETQPQASGKFRKALLGSSHSNNNASRKRGEYARLENSVSNENHFDSEDEEE